MALGQALFNQIIDFLMPYVTDVQDRRTLAMPALDHLKLINLLEWESGGYESVYLTSSDLNGDRLSRPGRHYARGIFEC